MSRQMKRDMSAPVGLTVAESETRPGELNLPTMRGSEPTGAEFVEHDGPGRLVVARGPVAGTSFSTAASRTTIGRSEECDIVINDVTVSRHHAEIRCEAERFTINDVDSLNGVYLNRQQVQRGELADGDEIWIGKARFTFRTTVPEHAVPEQSTGR